MLTSYVTFFKMKDSYYSSVEIDLKVQEWEVTFMGTHKWWFLPPVDGFHSFNI